MDVQGVEKGVGHGTELHCIFCSGSGQPTITGDQVAAVGGDPAMRGYRPFGVHHERRAC